MKTKHIICGILAIFCMAISVGHAENHVDGKALLEEILSSYSAGNVALSRQIQIVHSAVNFSESPGGKVIASLHGGELLECLSGSEFLKLRTRCGTTILRFYISLLITI